MKLLVGIKSVEPWHNSINKSLTQPRLALPYAFSTAFINEGHQVFAIDTANSSSVKKSDDPFSHVYSKSELLKALKNVDIALLWGGQGVSAIMRQILLPSPRKRVLLGSYVWDTSVLPTFKSRLSGVTAKLAAGFSRAVTVMTDEQLLGAQHQLSSRTPVIRFTCGIDASFYKVKSEYLDVPVIYQSEVDKLLTKPYVIMLGDQQRCNQDAIELIKKNDINLIRVCRDKKMSRWFKDQISRCGLEDKLFIFNDIDHVFLRFLIQNAACYAGLVDSSWQPAGWTVACESLACGTPVLLYDGLVSRELKKLGTDKSIMQTASFGDLKGFQEKLSAITSQHRSSVHKISQEFIIKNLDMEVTSREFVRNVENIL